MTDTYRPVKQIEQDKELVDFCKQRIQTNIIYVNWPRK